MLTEQQIVSGAKHQGGRGELTRARSDETARAHELAPRSAQSSVHRVTVFVVCMFEVTDTSVGCSVLLYTELYEMAFLIFSQTQIFGFLVVTFEFE